MHRVLIGVDIVYILRSGFQDVEALWGQYQQLLQKKQELLRQAIEEKKRSGLTEEQLEEIRLNFKYFDSSATGALSKRFDRHYAV